ncbi:unnamed protein product (macronuclear) [Paramecium tetraurelia]|uniref:Chromosome undetermined scaffold_1, whole genome shotgun sequence n=1 Tax=Paramecium tetraurelia TaxID=5888 RepID=Q6BG26_PARTE|nr:Oxidoreductase [Paramecium tetraurelia strain d4-2]XP_001423288.1 uncharacterized protein GSPATT00000325001 [Paramecium tetraurelia]CAH03394.1 Oxidoreductase, putative [Paramecium tetraurelia]CAK55890.1 unnamed protein product [Paramecium tetraurelia]|eukprot:XP_001423288.1 hypothetical protein (macronuclear) [Paramecium tetraurelia strain d4-2]
MQKLIAPLLTMNNGNKIPQIGYGTYQCSGKELVDGIKYALQVGYTHIDSASYYQNGKDIRVPKREDFFITSKIASSEQGYENTLKSCKKILQDLDTKYLDLLLIHWPGVAGNQLNSPNNATVRLQTYKALEQLFQEGLIKNIGVSNFLKHHLEHLLLNCKIKPVINQIEVHPLCWDQATIEYCRQQSILIEAYSPIARNDPKLIQNQKMIELSKKYHKTVAQVSLRWAVQKGFIVLPKSKTPKYIKENFEIFDFQISEEDIKVIDQLNENYHTCWDPSTVIY